MINMRRYRESDARGAGLLIADTFSEFNSPKVIAQDAGHLCQNLYLAATAIGAGACAIGAYDQAGMDAVLEVDGQDEFTIYVATVGKVE
jgi:nitroreductase